MENQIELFSPLVEKAHRPGQSTSRKAAEKSAAPRISLSKTVYDYLYRVGATGAIPEQIAQRMGRDLIDVRRAFSVLKKLGKIEATGEDRENARGNMCEVWRAI